MDLTKLPLFETMRERMGYLSVRQTVLAENVANANTPGYRARDVEAPDFAAMASGEAAPVAKLITTNSMHIATGPGNPGGFKVREAPDSESTPNGNSVVLEEQMTRVAQTQMDYTTVTQLYRKALNMLRMAAGSPR